MNTASELAHHAQEIEVPCGLEQVLPQAVHNALDRQLRKDRQVRTLNSRHCHNNVHVEHVRYEEGLDANAGDVVAALPRLMDIWSEVLMPLDVRLLIKGFLAVKFPARDEKAVLHNYIWTVSAAHGHIAEESPEARLVWHIVFSHILHMRLDHQEVQHLACSRWRLEEDGRLRLEN